MIAIEDSLIEELPRDSEVDGHDAGSGQVNIFILTDEPTKTFEDVEKILTAINAWANIRIAYRALERSEYAVLWPKNLKEFKLL
ncbi:hypothetical protein KXS07_20990 [Inquilinus limosus]|uniref:hypothetical protein n=1 Tax=Inquilinus limosus TaxID=171674 RepID=UPI003F153547